MKMSEYIAALQALQAQHGDLDVCATVFGGPLYAVRRDPALPTVVGVTVPTKREQYTKAVNPSHNSSKLPLTGERLFRI
jgi:hypothetical protein